jgi:dTDP-glucose 4,6-dehydratase
MLKAYGKQYGLPYVITRCCNVYGPGQQLWRLIPKVIYCIKKGIQFPLEGGGTAERCYLHVDDVCRAIELAAQQKNDVFHISSADLWDIKYILLVISDLMKIPIISFRNTPARAGQDSRYALLSHKLRKSGWDDKIGLYEGIQTVIDWMNANWSEVKRWPTEYRP